MEPVKYVRDTIDLVHQIESRFLELGARLYRIREEKLWADTYETYTDFLEAAHVDPTIASKLYSIHKNYIVEGGRDPAILSGVAYTNLYDAIPLIEAQGVDGAVIAASTLTRDEIKDEVREEKHGQHRHKMGTERWGTCEKCGKFIRVDEAK